MTANVDKKFVNVGSGFSLVEVVIALALFAVALPSILGIFGYFSEISVATRDRDETQSVANAIQIFLENDAGRSSDGSGVHAEPFATVYQWVVDARQSPVQAMVVYAFKHINNEAVYTVSLAPPPDDIVSALDGRVMAVEIHAPEPGILPNSALAVDASGYARSYLPFKMNIHALTTRGEARTNANLVESFPAVISR